MKVVDALPLMEARLDIAATCVSALAEAHAAVPAGEASKDARPAIKEVVSLRGQVLQCRMIAANAGEFVRAGGSWWEQPNAITMECFLLLNSKPPFVTSKPTFLAGAACLAQRLTLTSALRSKAAL